MFIRRNPDENLRELEQQAKLGDLEAKRQLWMYRELAGLCKWHGENSKTCPRCIPNTIEWDENDLRANAEPDGFIPGPLEEEQEWSEEDINLYIRDKWIELMQDLTELMSYHNTSESRWYWKVIGKNLGWRKASGIKVVEAESGEGLLRQILPHTDNTFAISWWTQDDDWNKHPYFKIVNSHHDAMNEIYYIEPYVEEEFET